MPHQLLVHPTCQRRSPSKLARQTTSSRMATANSHDFASRWLASASPQDSQTLRFAIGTLEFRKQRNRKRTSTGEYVWSDDADIAFALALIAWTSNRSYRIGNRRSVFLQEFLSNHGFTKTRKQIASRLQVLKGEWGCSPYLDLLKEPDDSEDPHSRRDSSSPLQDEQTSVSHATPPTMTLPSRSSSYPQITGANSSLVPGYASFSQTRDTVGPVPFTLPLYPDSHSHESFATEYSYTFDQSPRTTSSIEPRMDVTARQLQPHPQKDYVNGSFISTPAPLQSSSYATGPGRYSLDTSYRSDLTSGDPASYEGTMPIDGYFQGSYPFLY